MKRIISILLATVMILSTVSYAAPSAFSTIDTVFDIPVAVEVADEVTLASEDYNFNGSISSDNYYNLISKQDWDNAPGIKESEIVLNNDAGTYRQVLHVMRADMNNEYVNVIPTYNEMDTSDYQIATMLDQANWLVDNYEGNVMGVMNCCLSWYTGYAPERVNEPLGFMMCDGEIMFDPGNCGYAYGNVGFPTCVVINKDYDDNGNIRPADISKIEMVQIRSSADLDGWEYQVIPISSGYIVKDGVNQYTPNHTGPAPRSVVGITAAGEIVIMENDGRQEPFSAGMSMYECAEVMLDLGCVFAANCDGGGSSTFVSKRPGEELKVNNSPSDGALRASTSGIAFISTAPATGEFVKASVTTDNTYYTPMSEVQFKALGADLVGTPADIPEEAHWVVNEEMGTIDESGLFVSNGETGVVTAELIYNGNVVGSASINVVIPDVISFQQSVITVPNGGSTEFVVEAIYDEIYEVTTKVSDFEFVLSDDSIGVIDGYTFTATSDLTVTGGNVVVTLVHNTDKTSTAQLRFGKASEVIWDFENGTDDWATTMWKADSTRPYAYLAKSDVYSVDSSNGKVRNGNGAMALVADFTYSDSPTWNSFYLNYYGEDIVIENAQTLGCWLYIPDEIPYIEFSLRFYPDGSTSPKNALVAYGETEGELDSGWRYVTFDISKYKSIEFKSGYQFVQIYYGGIQGVSSLKPFYGVNSKVTYYIDDVTIDYSTAVADREAPVFGELSVVDSTTGVVGKMGAKTITQSLNSFEAVVADYNKDNAVGIDASSTVVYVDGVAVDCKYANGRITASDVELADGVHTVTFEIADRNNNVAKASGKINVEADSGIPTIKVLPKDDSLDRILIGSLYYVDVIATDFEETDSVVVTLDLNNHSEWELDHMSVAYGFEASYEIDATDPMDNIATVTITRVADTDVEGEAVLASLPIRTWQWKEEESPAGGTQYDFTPDERWADIFAFRTIISVDNIAGELTLVDDELIPFGADRIQVDTELYANSCTGVPNYEVFAGKDGWHVHTEVALEDKAASCTEAGYTDRTFCEVCNSVVEWGNDVPAVGHEYKVSGTQLVCDCGKVFTANGFVEFDGVLRYFVGENFVTGLNRIDSEYYNFHKDGTAYDGIINISGTDCLFERGISIETDEVILAGICGENVEYVIHADGRMVVVGSGAIYDFKSVGTIPWYQSNRYDVKSLYISKDITVIGNRAFYNLWYLESVTFEEGSKLEEIKLVGIALNSKLKELVLPNGLKRIGDASFRDLNAIERITIPSSVSYISSNSFYNSYKVVLSVAEGSYAESYAIKYGLKYVTFEEPEYILDDGVCGNGVTWEFTSKGTMTLSGSGSMSDYETKTAPWQDYKSLIKKVVIGKDVTYIGRFAFMQSKNLLEIIFEEGTNLESIGHGAFGYCTSLKKIEIPASVKELNNYAFYYCTALETVEFGENSELNTIGAYAFWNDFNIKTLFVPDKVLSIGENGFLGCKDTCTFYVAEGTYGHNYFATNNIVLRDAIAFEIANGTCGKNVIWSLDSKGTMTLSGSGAMSDYETRTAPWQDYKSLIKKIVIGKDVTYIGRFAFMQSKNLSEIIFEEGTNIESIGHGAFGYCTSLKKIEIPASVKELNNYAFYYCTALETVEFGENSELNTIGAYAFWNCINLGEITDCEDVEVGEGAFLGTIISK